MALGHFLTGVVIAGAATVVVAPILTLVWRRSRRPTACRKAHASILILLGGALALGWLGVALHEEGRALPDSTACVVVAFVLAMLGASGILAVWGLVDILSSSGKLKEGLWPSIVTLFLICGWVGGGLFMAVLHQQRTRPPPAEVKAAPRPAPLAPGPREDHVFASLNCALREPGLPWVRLREKAFNPDSTIEFLRTNPSIYLQVIAEIAEPGSYDLKGFEAFVEAGIRSRARSVEIVDRQRLALGGVEGVSLNVRVGVGELNIRYLVWLSAHNGFLWQLFVWGDEAQAGRVEKEARDIFAGFRVLDPARLAGPRKAAEAAGSEHLGWRVSPAEGWGSWVGLDSLLPLAVYGCEIGPSTKLALYAVSTLGQDPPFEGVAYALLRMAGYDPPAPDASVKRWSEAGLERLAFGRDQRRGDKDWRTRVRVVRGRVAAWAALAWGPKGAVSDEALDRALDAVSLHDPDTAPSPADFSERESLAQARFFNEIGVWRHDGGDPRLAAAAFRTALELSRDDAVIRLNAVRALRQSGQAAAALELAAAKPEGALGAERASLLLEGGRRSEALQAWAELFAGGYDDAEAFGAYAGALEEEDPERALRELDAALARNNVTRVAVLKAGVLTRRGRADEAVASLKARIEGPLFDVEAAQGLLDVYEAAERHSEQAAWAETMLARGVESARAWASKGRAELELGWHKRSKASFEKALEKAPGHEAIKSSLAAVSALLGEGDNSEIKSPLEPVPLPGDDAPAPGPDAFKPWASHDAVVTRYGVAVEGWGRRARKTVYLRARALTFRGVERFSAFRFDFHPLAERVYVNRLAVLDAQGNVVSRGDPSDAYVLDTPSDGIPSSSRTLNIPVTGLKPGLEVDLVFTREDRAEATRGALEDLGFAWDLPCFRMAFFARGRVRAAVTGGLSAREIDGGRLWSAGPLKPWPAEPLQGDASAPRVWVGPADASWESEARSYLEDLKDALAMEEEVASTASERAKGHADERARALALAGFAQKEVAYHAVAFGRRGRMPRRGAEVLRRKLGDCKDQSVLLHLLLRAAGVKSSLALVRTDAEIPEDVPSLDAFDHMIVHVPVLGFVDPTQKDLDPGLGVPQGQGGRWTLLLDPERPRLERIPPPAASAVEGTRQVTARPSGEARVRESLSFRGYAAADLRGALRSTRPEARGLLLRHRLGHAQAEIDGFEVEGLDDTAAPLLLRLDYRLPRVFQEVEGRRYGRLPALWERDALELPPSHARATPFRIREVPVWTMTVDAKVEGPGEAVLEGKPSDVEAGSFADWSVEAPDRATLRYRLALREGERPAEDYAACRAAVERALAAVERPFIVKP